MSHNHEPLCCCGHSPASVRGRCPACPEHGYDCGHDNCGGPGRACLEDPAAYQQWLRTH